MPNQPSPEQLPLLPDPQLVHNRLGEVLREAALLRRLLTLSLRGRDEARLRDRQHDDDAEDGRG